MQKESSGRNITVWFVVGFLIVITVVVIIAGATSNSSDNSSNASSTFVSTTAPAITSSDWQEGNPNAKVTLIEYGDFECPACGAYFPLVQQLFNAESSSILFVFRNFPLYTIHPDAGIAAQAAEAAGLQGKYWQMHDLLYENQTSWTAASPNTVVSQFFDGYAQSLGLNVNTFNQDINSSAVLTKIQNDVNGGNSAQIDHTPTFFINLQQIPNPSNYDSFKADIDQAIASSSS
jgi:protein-disulfide isomerase